MGILTIPYNPIYVYLYVYVYVCVKSDHFPPFMFFLFFVCNDELMLFVVGIKIVYGYLWKFC